MIAKHVTIVAVLLVLASALAADARPQVDWDQPLNLSLADADLGQVLKSFARITGGTLVAEIPLDGEVTVELVRTPFADALGQICSDHALRCEWHDESGRLVVHSANDGGFRGLSRQQVTIQLVAAPLDQTLGAMASISDGAMVVEGDFEGSATLSLRNVAWPLALERLCAEAGCSVDWSSEPVQVTPRADGADRVRVQLVEPDAPDASHEALVVSMRFAPDDTKPTEAFQVFDWATPVRRLAAGDWRLHSAWLPLDPPVFFQMVEHCGPRGWASPMNPIRLDGHSPGSFAMQNGWWGGSVSARSVAPADRDASVSTASDAEPCPWPAASPLRVVVRDSVGVVSETELSAVPGSYVMLEPAAPRSSIGGSAIAILHAGHRIDRGIEEQRVFFVYPPGPRLDAVSLKTGQPHVESFGTWSIELALGD